MITRNHASMPPQLIMSFVQNNKASPKTVYPLDALQNNARELASTSSDDPNNRSSSLLVPSWLGQPWGSTSADHCVFFLPVSSYTRYKTVPVDSHQHHRTTPTTVSLACFFRPSSDNHDIALCLFFVLSAAFPVCASTLLALTSSTAPSRHSFPIGQTTEARVPGRYTYTFGDPFATTCSKSSSVTLWHMIRRDSVLMDCRGHQTNVKPATNTFRQNRSSYTR